MKAGLSDHDRDVLVEQYKLYVAMADEISKRRVEANRFYMTLVGGGFAALSVVLRESNADDLNMFLVFMVAVLGAILCVTWHQTIVSYKRLNKGKYAIVHEMEERLPFAPYSREWKVLNPDEPDPDHKPYNRLTDIEAYVPFLLGLAYGGLAFWAMLA